MNWLSQPVSMVESVRHIYPRTCTIGSWVMNNKHTDWAGVPKKMRPALMPHGLFSNGRKAENLSHPSGLMQFDVDTKDNPGLCVADVKRRAANVPGVVLVANSVNGGCWGLAVREPDMDAQLTQLEQQLGVILDKVNSRSMAALRFAAHDAAPYLKP
jgi:hypothetical protein